MVVIVKQPRVDVAFAQGRLDSGEVHGQTSIVNKRKDFGRIPPSHPQAVRGTSRFAKRLRIASIDVLHSSEGGCGDSNRVLRGTPYYFASTVSDLTSRS